MPALRFFICLLAAMTATGGVAAQMPGGPAGLPCHDYERMAKTLGERYGETPVSLGLQSNGHVIQVFSSAESGSWTILSIAPSGIGCVVAAGHGWQTRLPPSADRPA